jgi:arsenate reductase
MRGESFLATVCLPEECRLWQYGDTMKVYTYKNCSTCRKATQWLRAKGIAFVELPIRETPPDALELRAMLDHQGGELRRLFNTAGADYRQLNLKTKLPGMSQEEAVTLLAGQGNLVKRPFLIDEKVGLVGFHPEKWAQALNVTQ